MTNRQLVAVHCSVSKVRRIVFHYKMERWEIFESIRPWSIREALRISLQRIDEAMPGTLEKAAVVDDKNWQRNRLRTRRYIAASADLLYIGSPHLHNSQSVSLDSTLLQIFRGVMFQVS